VGEFWFVDCEGVPVVQFSGIDWRVDGPKPVPFPMSRVHDEGEPISEAEFVKRFPNADWSALKAMS
jgi:hypothetical protein